MKKSAFQFGLICAAAGALSVSAMAQSGSTGSGSDSPGALGSSGSSSSQSQSTGSDTSSSSESSRTSDSGMTSPGSSTSDNWSSSKLSATGRSSSNQQALRGSKLMGAEVTDSSGEQVGRIEDVIVNPTSGKIEFAVISRSGQGGAESPGGLSSGSNSGSTSSRTPGTRSHSEDMGGAQGGTRSDTTSMEGSASSSGKLVPVPWSLLQSSSTSSATSTRSIPGSGQQSFTLSVDSSKLDAAPALSRGSWSEIGKSGWSQRVNSYYGIPESGTSSTGAAESPSGSNTGAGSSGGDGGSRY
ncbi:MAG TPA: PRC-barrel domain-containing protein [Verrucomicrobiae bacterium]|nr:PRC-barrel domain-containing protein [Verrucomicrobiae bacterium]